MTQASQSSSILTLLTQHRDLLYQMSVRDIHARYRGSLLGVLWMILTPLLMLAIYTFVFGVVFQARWGTNGESDTLGFALTLYSGLIVHSLLGDVLTRSTSIILQHGNYVKKVVFPLGILPVMVVSSALFFFIIQLAVLLVVMLLCGYTIPPTALLIPLVIAPLLLFCLGAGWMIASIGVFIRDLQHLMGLLVTMLLFLSPIFYPASALPEAYRPLLYLNPLTPIIENLRAVLMDGRMPDWNMLVAYALLSLLFCQLGHVWFNRTRKGFNDVL